MNTPEKRGMPVFSCIGRCLLGWNTLQGLPLMQTRLNSEQNISFLEEHYLFFCGIVSTRFHFGPADEPDIQSFHLGPGPRRLAQEFETGRDGWIFPETTD
jgi:hypothetical protein